MNLKETLKERLRQKDAQENTASTQKSEVEFIKQVPLHPRERFKKNLVAQIKQEKTRPHIQEKC